jgi:hypothetical protein
MSKTGKLIALAVLAVAIGRPGLAQQDDLPRVELSEPEASFSEPFSSIAGLRELADGRVIVSDRLEIALRIVDLATGSVKEIGHEGSGPGEYRMPDDLFPLPGDSTLLVDFGNMRLTAITPNGELVESQAMMHPDGFLLFPRGTDADGRLYFDLSNVMRMGPGESLPDSFAVVAFDRGTGDIDTIAMLPRPQIGQVRSSGQGFSFSGLGLQPFQAVDEWSVAFNGRVAVAWGEEYHVEWRSVGGPPVVGPAVAYEPVKLTQEDKEAWADRMSSGAVMAISVDGGGGRGGRTVTLPRPNIDELDWPEVKPPFPRNALRVTPDGEAWVQRHVKSGEPETYDVFDASGRRVRQVVLPEGRTLVGFGRGTLYASNEDEDGLQWLERYRR